MKINKLHYFMEKKMQYLHDNLNMHIVCEEKLQYPHYDPNPHICGSLICNTYMTI
jgi:hypothetical protein